MRIKNMKKFIRSILIILLVIIGLSLLISKATYSYKEKQYKNVYVETGDTLWNIASVEAKSNKYYKNKDIRYIINDLMKINNLNNSEININQQLLVPVI